MASLGNDLSDMQCRIEATNALSVVIIVMGVACFGFGIPTVALTTSNPAYPFSSGSGIYSGLLVIVAGILGMVLLHKIKTTSPVELKALNITFRVFLSIALDVGLVHFAYGIWSVVVCSRGVTESTCGGVNWSANYLLAVVNMVIGFTIAVVSLIVYILTWTLLKRLWQMGKVANSDTEMAEK